MKVVFNNGDRIEISQEIAEIINKSITEGCKQFLQLSGKDDKTFLTINLSEVSYIN